MVGSLALAYTDLETAVLDFLGLGATEDVDDVIDAGYRWFLSGEYVDPRRRDVLLYWSWSFLYPWAALTVWPTTTTGALTIWGTTTTGAVTVGGVGNTTLTVAADTFYENMVGEAIVGNVSETSYKITGYTDAKNITVDADASADDGGTFTITADGKTVWTATDTFYPGMVGHALVADTSGTSYVVTAYTDANTITVSADATADNQDTFTITADGLYALPDAFGDLMDPFTYAEGTGLDAIQRVSDARIRQAKAAATVTGDPYWCSILPRAAHDGYVLETTGTFWDVLMFPTPSVVRILTYRYKLLVSALDGSTHNYPLGGPDFAQVVLQCCLAKAEQMRLHETGPQTALAQSDLAAAVRRDAAKTGSKRLGKSIDTSDRRAVRRWPATTDVTHPW